MSQINQFDLNDYELIKIIGQGGYGMIVKAKNKKNGKYYAIKFYNTTGSEDQRRYIERAIEVSNSGSPYLVKTLGFRDKLTIQDQDYTKYSDYNLNTHKKLNLTGYALLMNLYEPSNLADLMKDYLDSNGLKNKIINPTIRSKIIFGVASIMKNLHQRNIIYRNLKIHNVLLDENKEPILADFEHAKYIVNPLDMTFNVGTPFYMAPELFTCEYETYSFSVDVYAFAIFLYNMFSKTFHFADRRNIGSCFQVMSRISKGERPIKTDDIPDCYWELIQMCWKQDPNERPTFEEITVILRSDKFGIKEFGMKTDMDQLHEYQTRIDG